MSSPPTCSSALHMQDPFALKMLKQTMELEFCVAFQLMVLGCHHLQLLTKKKGVNPLQYSPMRVRISIWCHFSNHVPSDEDLKSQLRPAANRGVHAATPFKYPSRHKQSFALASREPAFPHLKRNRVIEKANSSCKMDFPSRVKPFYVDTEHLLDNAQDLSARIGHTDSSMSTSVARQEDWGGPSAGSARHVPSEARTMNLLSVLNPISPEAFEKLKRENNLDIIAKEKSQGPQEHKTRMKHRATKKRHNKAYTPEQVHYIMYHREDLELPWLEVRDKYRKRYNVTDCFEGALQSRHYRAQLVPFLDIEADPVLDTNGAVIMRKMTVRERNHKIWTIPILDSQRRPATDDRNRILMRELTKAERDGPMGTKLKHTLDKYFKLGDRLPGLLCKYKDWVKSEHQEEGKKKEKYRLDHGIVLPGAAQCGGEFVDTVVAVNAAGTVLKDEFHHA